MTDQRARLPTASRNPRDSTSVHRTFGRGQRARRHRGLGRLPSSDRHERLGLVRPLAAAETRGNVDD